LQKVLDSSHPGMIFVESVMDKYDAPIDLIVGGHALADSDYGVPGPQSAANAQIPLPTCPSTIRTTAEEYTRIR
jgi:indolepyruvate decarboxylase